MIRHGFGVVVLAAAVLAASAAQQDGITIKVTKPKAGDRVRVTKTEKTKTAMTFGIGGKTQAKDETVTKTIVYVDEIITGGDGAKPTKLKRTYEKYEVSKGGKDEAGPPLNTAILIEKAGEKYTFTADGKPVEAGVAAKLSAEFDKGSGSPKVEEFLPKKPIKPGETWKVDGEKMAKAFGGDANLVLDTAKSEVNGKLVKAYQKDGKQYGVIEFDGQVVIKSLGEKTPLTVKPGGKMGFKMTADACTDGTDPSMKMTGALTVKMDAEGMGITMSLSADGTVTETTELLKK